MALPRSASVARPLSSRSPARHTLFVNLAPQIRGWNRSGHNRSADRGSIKRAHVLLCPYKGVVADMNPASKWLTYVGDGQHNEGNEESGGKYHEGVHPWLCRAEQGG